MDTIPIADEAAWNAIIDGVQEAGSDDHGTCYDEECDGSAHEAEQRETIVYEAKRHAQMIAAQVAAYEDDRLADLAEEGEWWTAGL